MKRSVFHQNGFCIGLAWNLAIQVGALICMNFESWRMYIWRDPSNFISLPPPSGKWTTAHNGHIVHVNFCIIHVSCDITRLLWNHEPSRKPSSLGTFQNNLPWCIFVKCYQVFTFTLWKLKTIESTIKKLGKLKGMRWIPPPRVYP